MVTLGQILGGIVRDVVQARLGADQMVLEAAKAYAGDPLLAAFPLPRVGIKDATIKLRFAIDAVAEKDIRKEVETELRELWKGELTRTVLPKAAAPQTDVEALKRATDAITKARAPEFGIAAVLNGDVTRLIRESTTFLNAELGKLPAATRNKLASLKVGVPREMRATADAFALRAKQILDARVAGQTALQVLVRKADLEKAPEQTMHEFTFTLSIEDVQITNAGSSQKKEP
jgi:hypothetical protein